MNVSENAMLSLAYESLSSLPLGVMVLRPIRDERGYISDFELKFVNEKLKNYIPSLSVEGGRHSLLGNWPQSKENGFLEQLTHVVISQQTLRFEFEKKDEEGLKFFHVNACFKNHAENTLLATLEDVTSKAKSSRLAEIEEKLLQKSEKMANMGRWHMDVKSRRMFFNENMFAIFELNEKELIGDPLIWQQKIHPEDLEYIRAEFDKALHEGEPFDVLFRLLFEKCHVRHLRVISEVFTDDRGNPLKIIGSCIDLTANEKVVEECYNVKNNYQKFRHKAIRELTRSIAHQWRQPLNSFGMAMHFIGDVLDDNGLMEGDTEMLFHQTIQSLDKVSHTIDLLSGRLYKSGKPQEFDAVEVISKIVEFERGKLEADNIRISFNEIEEDKRHMLYGNQSEFSHILISLINNSKDAIELRREKDPVFAREFGNIVILASSFNNVFRLAVMDNGSGVEEAHLDFIFDPYFSTKFSAHDVGLSLFLVKALMEEMFHGDINVANYEDGFRVELIFPNPRIS